MYSCIHERIFIFIELMKHLQEHAHVKHVPNTSKAIKEEHAVSPNLDVKQEPMSDVIPIGMVNTSVKSLFQTTTENGQEIIELLDSDNEVELVDASENKGMSSDTMVGDFDIEMNSDDDDEPHSFHD